MSPERAMRLALDAMVARNGRRPFRAYRGEGGEVKDAEIERIREREMARRKRDHEISRLEKLAAKTEDQSVAEGLLNAAADMRLKRAARTKFRGTYAP